MPRWVASPAGTRPQFAASIGNKRLIGSRSRQQAPVQTRAAAHAGAGRPSSGGVLVLPGFLFSSRQYSKLVADLRNKGFHAEVLPTSLSDWLPVLAGGSFEWYLQRTDAALAALHARHGRVALVGHSAGGWLPRILLGGEPYQGVRYGRSAWVHTLLTLGTPHQSIEAYPFGRAEEALVGPHLAQAPPAVCGSSLRFANHFYPDAASLGGVRVVCACGNAIRGQRLWGDNSSNGSSTGSSSGGRSSSSGGGGGAKHSRWDCYFAYEAYKSGCGRGDVDGDGVTPLCISQLPGAEELVLPGVWHSPRRSPGQMWYGDLPVQPQWQQFLLESQAAARTVGQSHES